MLDQHYVTCRVRLIVVLDNVGDCWVKFGFIQAFHPTLDKLYCRNIITVENSSYKTLKMTKCERVKLTDNTGKINMP